MTDPDLYRAITSLQLPIPDEYVSQAYTAILTELSNCGANSAQDAAISLSDMVDSWVSSSTPSRSLKAAIDAGLSVVDDEFALNGEEYFKAYATLRKGGNDSPGLPHSTAILLLSRSRLILHLVSVEKFSASQITLVFAATENSLVVPYRAIQTIAQVKKVVPALREKEAGERLWETDASRSALLFADSDEWESCTIAAEQVSLWAPQIFSQCESVLLSLVEGMNSDPKAGKTWRYLQILHWCTISQEFFNHPPTSLYEFKPRSNLYTEIICGKYPATTGNPVLNNAKAVARLDYSWAMNRSGTDAHSLVSALEMLESLPYLARREVARILRAWIIRIIDLDTEEVIQLPADMSLADYLTLTLHICDNETNTAGVIEQRIVEALGVVQYGKGRWKSRGLGDSVNASNLSRKKLGDIEFANIDERTAIAIEAHGGTLSRVYVAAHHKSLVRIVNQRLEQSWLALDEAEKWSVHVVFVGHDIEPGLPTTDTISGVTVTYSYVTYRQFAESCLSGADRADVKKAFDSHVRQALGRRTVRQTARNKVLTIINENTETVSQPHFIRQLL